MLPTARCTAYVQTLLCPEFAHSVSFRSRAACVPARVFHHLASLKRCQCAQLWYILTLKPTGLLKNHIFFFVIGSERCSSLTLGPDIFQTLGFLETSQYRMPLNFREVYLPPEMHVFTKTPKTSATSCSPGPISTMSPVKCRDVL
ncbi:hypothetical protein HJG60_008018 [Phyllostomus discolor]|uniref:Uncharacterized protein n=1 Tax=Phyllostomus discolor TaxID=89673 RepID=A0A834BLG6_9CHIR|nr:hypothetical protein HJG60_008018 [Phyllostomus discolor]